jgi:riboflavin transporter FmnP
MESKTIAFMAVMGALGNILFLISSYLGPIASGVALDLSLIPVFIAALYGGPLVGFLTGLFVGIFPGIYFGPLGQGSWLGIIGLPIGKALTGFTAGFLYKGLDVDHMQRKSILTIPLVLVSYIPECLFTVAYFVSLLPYFIGGGGIGILIFVVPKAWVEIVFMSFFMAALVGNYGFSTFIANFFASYKTEMKS